MARQLLARARELASQGSLDVYHAAGADPQVGWCGEEPPRFVEIVKTRLRQVNQVRDYRVTDRNALLANGIDDRRRDRLQSIAAFHCA